MTQERLDALELTVSKLGKELEDLKRWVQFPRKAEESGRVVQPPPLPVVPAEGFGPVMAAAVMAELGPIEPVVIVERGQEKEERAEGEKSWEARIGLNWTAWVGAIVLVLGAGFFLKYAWEVGWIRPSPLGRVIATIFIGVLIVGAGEWVFRKAMRGLAGGLYGCGLAIMMAGLFAGHAYFDPPVLSLDMAFWGVAMVAGIGVAIAIRRNMGAVAVIALLGAYLSPAVLHSNEDRSLALAIYVGLVTAGAWGVCALRPRWVMVMGLALGCSAFWYFAWYVNLGHLQSHESLATGWAATAYIGFLAAIFLGTQRCESGGVVEGNLACLAFLNTIVAAIAFYLRYDHDEMLLGGLALGAAGVQALVALGSERAELLRVSAIVQAVLLVTAAVPLLTHEFVVTAIWVAMGIGMAIVGRKANVKWPWMWAVGLLILAMGRLILLDRDNPVLKTTLMNWGGYELTKWLLMGWGVALAGHVLAWVRPKGDEGAQAGGMVAGLGSVAFLITTAMAWAFTPGWSVAGMILAVVIIAISDRGLRVSDWIDAPEYSVHGWLLAAAIAAKWVIVDGLISTWDAWDHGGDGVPMVNATFLAGGLIVVSFGWLWAQSREKEQPSDLETLALGGMVVTAFALVNFEVCRGVNWIIGGGPEVTLAKQMALSVLWGVMALVAIAIGFIRKEVGARYGGLGLLGITVCKILLVDMASVERVWRILSFAGVGGVMMVVSYLYNKQLKGTFARSSREAQ